MFKCFNEEGGHEVETQYTKTKQEHIHSKKKSVSFRKWIGGICFTFMIALLGYLLAKLPGFDHVGQLASAIIIAVLYRQFFDYPELLRSGIEFSSKRLLRFCDCFVWSQTKYKYSFTGWFRITR